MSGTTYPWWKYGCQVILAAGMAMFMFDGAGDRASEGGTTIAGVVMMGGYIGFDSFTSNYQSGLFKTHGVSKFQMMFGVNLFSCIFTLWALLQTGKLWPSLAFVSSYPLFGLHIAILSLTSCTGQVFIFHTISTYGPLVFTIIMTTRQVMSLLLSTFFYSHSMGTMGVLGVCVIFGSMFLNIYLQQTIGRK